MPDARQKPYIDIERAGVWGETVIAAVSGGADSVALLLLLSRARDAGQISLAAAHFEHGIRGADSIRDMEFVQNLCARLSIPLNIERANVPREAARAREGIETCARRLRRAFLENARESAGARAVALAHHADDQAETVLMHLLRGSGTSGAQGMRERDGFWWRPLIYTPKRVLTDYLVSEGQAWREDETNYEPSSPRNILRLEVMPKLNKAYPASARALTRFAEISSAEDALMDSLTDTVLAERARGYAGIACLQFLPSDDISLIRRAIRKLMPQFDFDDVERARTAKARVELSGGTYAESINGTLYITPPLAAPARVNISDKREYELAGVCVLKIDEQMSAPIRGEAYAQALKPSALAGAQLRLRERGDYIRPLGMGGKSKSFSDYLTDRKTPRPLRARMPVIARAGEILWAAGAGISETAKLEHGEQGARLTIQMNTDIGGKHNA